MLRMLTAGESHGPVCLVIVEGMPAGLKISREDINPDLKKRRSDFGRGGRGALEADEVEILSGVRHGLTLGSPVTLMVRNADNARWGEIMAIGALSVEPEKLTQPRPGHADLAGALKYGQDDIRNVLERASARETVSRVMAGAVARKLLDEFDIRLASHTVQIGPVRVSRAPRDFRQVASVFETDPEIRCIEPEGSDNMKAAIREAREKGDTLGGVVEVIAAGAPVGLGSVMHWDRRLDTRLAAALMSIPSVKAVEIGDGFRLAGVPGSQAVDSIGYQDGRYVRGSNNMGGIEGGISNGQDIVCRVYHKPVPTMGNPAATVDIRTHEAAPAARERSDVCIVPRAGVISEAMLAWVLAEAMTEKFGGDSLPEMKRNFKGYMDSLKER